MSRSTPFSMISSGSSFQSTAVITESPITVTCGAAASARETDVDVAPAQAAASARARSMARRICCLLPPSVCHKPHACATPATMYPSAVSGDPIWDEQALSALTDELGDVYRDRTALVTGADGFMGSHLTDALVELGANVHAFVRATSSGALNNIGHLRNRLKVHFADLTDKTSVDYLMKELKQTGHDRPYVFHLGAQAHVGESWHRPYETVMANTVGTLNLLQSIVDTGLEVEKFDTAGTSEEYGNVRDDVSHHHDFDHEGGLILHERSPINPKSIYATAKVAADFLTMNYHDAFAIPAVVTRMFNNYGPRQNPRYVTGTIITQALE